MLRKYQQSYKKAIFKTNGKKESQNTLVKIETQW